MMKPTYVILGLIISFTLFVSLRTLTSQPRFFADEALTIEMSRNLAEHGVADIMTQPGIFSKYSHLFTTTGYTVSLPLTLVFKITGVSFTYARLTMTLWLLAAVFSIYFVVKSLWDETAGLFSAGLTASFAAFYGNGMQVMGEVPGFVFLLWGFYWFFKKNDYRLTGLFFGLATVSKPSIYLLILPAFGIYIFFSKKENLRKLTRFGTAAAVPLLFYFFWITCPNIFETQKWQEMAKLYSNPSASESQLDNIVSNIKTYWNHSTILYFGAILAAVTFLLKKYIRETRGFFTLAFIYFAFLAVYFLRSPGWFRYIFPIEMLLLVSFFPAVSSWNKKYAVYASSAMILLQIFQLFFFRGDVKDTSAQDTAAYINGLGKPAGIINSLEAYSLLTVPRYQIVEFQGVPLLGKNPLLTNPLPEIIAFKGSDNKFVLPHTDILEKYYRPKNKINSYRIYGLKSSVF